MSATLIPTGALKSYINELPEISVVAERTVREILSELGIPPLIVALVVVNGTQQDKDYLVQDGDMVKVVAIMGGG